MEDPTNISRVYNSRNNLFEILDTIGYDVSEYLNYSIHHVATLYKNNQLNLLLSKKDPEDKRKLYVKYHIDGSKTASPTLIKMTSQTLLKMKDEFFREEPDKEPILTKQDTLMIIVKDDPSESITELLDMEWNMSGFYITVINITRLQYNILKHTYVPKHTILSDEEVEQVSTRYNMSSISEFPNISRHDAVATIMCMRPNQVCHILRKSKTSIESDYYRVCV